MIHKEDFLPEEKSNEDGALERIPIGQVKDLSPITEYLSEDMKMSIKLTPREVLVLTKDLNEKIYFGPAAALPMICKGPKCPIAKSCMLEAIGKAPIGSKCPIELAMINKWKDDYVASLGATWEDKIERQAIMDLVESEVFRHRANGILAAEDFIMENAIGVNPDTGEPILSKQKHIALEVADQLSRRQERLLKSLIATREMKEKLGKGQGDQSKKEADLVQRMKNAMAKERGEVIDAKVVKESGEDD